MKVLILEDEQYVAKRLIRLLDKLDFEYELLGVIDCVKSALAWFEKNDEPDLIFSDIQLLDGTSFNIFDKVKLNSYVIFTTSYDEYAIKAFRVNSIDYLLKPITTKKLELALDKLPKQDIKSQSNGLEDLLAQLQQKSKTYKSRFLIKIGSSMNVIDVSDIAYFYMKDGLNFLITNSGKKCSVDLNMEELEECLDPKDFFRINRQIVLNAKSIVSINTFFNSRLILELKPTFGNDVIVTRSRMSDFKEWLDN